MRRVFGAALVAVLLTAGPVAAHAAVRHDAYPLHAGPHASYGQRVQDLQWLLQPRVPRQNVFKAVRGTFLWVPNGYFGARTKHAVVAYKFRIGYPKAGECGEPKSRTLIQPTAGADLFAFIRGTKTRPRCWVALAAERVKGVVREGATANARAIQLLEVAQLGVHEIPDGSNRGPCISTVCSHDGDLEGPYQGSTGAFGAAWCASFADWALITITGHGFGSANNAYVPTIAEYAQARNWLAAKPKVGSFVIFLSNDLLLVNAFHIGYVVRVTASGIQTVEGNYANAVHEVFRDFNSNHMLYVNVPGVA